MGFFYLKIFSPHFERASRTLYQLLTCRIWKDNEIVVIV